jgi:hypothetical protein
MILLNIMCEAMNPAAQKLGLANVLVDERGSLRGPNMRQSHISVGSCDSSIRAL